MATLFVDKLDPQSGTALEIGTSGDTITVPSGATVNVAGTATGQNYPAFNASRGSNQTGWSASTWTKIQFDDEFLDTNGDYDNSTNYRFTPTVAGEYLCYYNVIISYAGGGTVDDIITALKKWFYIYGYFYGRIKRLY